MGRLRDERGEMEEERRIGEPSLFDTLYKKIVSRKHSVWVKKYIREREQYGECNILLRELAAAEVVKCVQYM